MSRYLLDTHVWLWMLTEPERLGALEPVVRHGGTELLLSAASTWEITIKHALGKLVLPLPVADYVPTRMRSSRVTALPITTAHTLAVADLEAHHADPFDRILIAQAIVEGVSILTADRAIGRYPVEVHGP